MNIFFIVTKHLYCIVKLRLLEWQVYTVRSWYYPRSKKNAANYCKFLKRYKYLHNFAIETWIYLAFQLLYLKNRLLEFCAVHNVLGFQSTLLGKCLKTAADQKARIRSSKAYVRYKPALLKFSGYLHRLAHPDPERYEVYTAQPKTPTRVGGNDGPD